MSCAAMTTAPVEGRLLEQRSVPVVAARRKGNILIIDHCPLCGQRHEHGLGGSPGPLHHRIAHCVPTCRRPIDRDAIGRGYWLCEVATPRLATRQTVFWNGVPIGEVSVTPPPRTAPDTRPSVRYRVRRFRATAAQSLLDDG
jgi:hypothetical protein